MVFTSFSPQGRQGIYSFPLKWMVMTLLCWFQVVRIFWFQIVRIKFFSDFLTFGLCLQDSAPQGSGLEPDLSHKAYYMSFSCSWRFAMKLRLAGLSCQSLLFFFDWNTLAAPSSRLAGVFYSNLLSTYCLLPGCWFKGLLIQNLLFQLANWHTQLALCSSTELLQLLHQVLFSGSTTVSGSASVAIGFPLAAASAGPQRLSAASCFPASAAKQAGYKGVKGGFKLGTRDARCWINLFVHILW